MSERDPSISVVIPAFATPDKALTCLQHALRQSMSPQDYEVILVDDASPQSLEGVCCHLKQIYPEHRLIYRRNAVNSGRAITRNNGIEVARGQVLMFLDVDNLLAPNALERMLEHLRQFPGSARANIRSRRELVSRSGYARFFNSRYLGERPSLEAEGIHPNRLHERFFATDAVAVMRRALEKVGSFDTTFSDYGCEDEELGMRLADAGIPFSFARDVLVTDDDTPTVRRACERMITYAQKSVPRMVKKHPRYVEHCMFPFLEKPAGQRSFKENAMRAVALNVPDALRSALMRFLEQNDEKVVPSLLYKIALTLSYAKGFKSRG